MFFTLAFFCALGLPVKLEKLIREAYTIQLFSLLYRKVLNRWPCAFRIRGYSDEVLSYV